jgi:hypothetical protein
MSFPSNSDHEQFLETMRILEELERDCHPAIVQAGSGKLYYFKNLENLPYL